MFRILFLSIIISFTLLFSEDLNIAPKNISYNDTKWDSPIIISTKEKAELYFSKKDLIDIDFRSYTILIFVWSGSGGDRLTYNFVDKNNSRIIFNKKSGMTMDYHNHSKVYILKNDIKWEVKK